MFRMFKQMRKINRTKLGDDEWYETDENGRGVIDVGAENYDDIFSYYDLEGQSVLDNEFVEFLEAKADAIPLKKELALHFHIKDPTEEKQAEMEKAIKNHYKRQVRACNRRLRRVSLFSLYMFIMGLVFLAIYIPLEIFEVYFVVPYIFDIASWVFFWEAVDQWFIHRREIKHEMLVKFRFVRSDVSVYKYVSKKKKEIKFGNNAKALNKILKQVDKTNKINQNKIEKLQSITKSQENYGDNNS